MLSYFFGAVGGDACFLVRHSTHQCCRPYHFWRGERGLVLYFGAQFLTDSSVQQSGSIDEAKQGQYILVRTKHTRLVPAVGSRSWFVVCAVGLRGSSREGFAQLLARTFVCTTS